MLDEPGSGDGPSGVAHQLLEEREFPISEMDVLAATDDHMTGQIHFQIADSQEVKLRSGTPQECADARNHFPYRKWSYKDVIGTGLECFYPLRSGCASSQHQHRGPHSFCTQPFQNLTTHYLFNAAIEHDDVIWIFGSELQCSR